MKKILASIGFTLSIVLVALAAYVFYPWTPMPASSFEIIAHRGVHQTFPLENLENDTCTGTIIDPVNHEYIENTLPSMKQAFASGATMVELDIHRTIDDQLVVFHDWTLDCRTNGKGVTNEQTLEYLKSLDVGYGYTADGGKTFPLRGKGQGLMLSLDEVLTAFPNQKLVIDNKDGGEKTTALLAAKLAPLSSEQRANIYYWGAQKEYQQLQKSAPEIHSYLTVKADIKRCLLPYLGILITSKVGAECRPEMVGLPISILPKIPGWPNLILTKFHEAGIKVVVTDVDTIKQWEMLKDLPLDGIQTNRVETVAHEVRHEKIGTHLHAGFVIWENGKALDFSDDTFMHVAPCAVGGGEHDFSEVTERVHLHSNIGNVAHVHDEGVTWRNLFESLNLKDILEANIVGYLNGTQVENPLDQPIRAYENMQFFVATDPAKVDWKAAVVTQEMIRQAEKSAESCGS